MAVTNLTNTKWRIDSVTCTAGYGKFEIYGINHSNDEFSEIYYFNIGYSVDFDLSDIWKPTANSIAYMSDPNCLFNVNDEITITGGPDVTNSNLISWLTSHATKIEPSSDVIETTISVGTSLLSDASIGTTKLLKAFIGNNLIFERLGGNFLTSDGKLLLTSDNKIFNVQEAGGYTASFTRGGGHLENLDDWSYMVQYSLDNGATYNAFTMTKDTTDYYIPEDITGITHIKFRVKNTGLRIDVKVKQDNTILCQANSTTTWVESNNIELLANTSFEISCILDN